MNTSLFISISKKAHALTKAYRRRYSCTYSVQFGIFFRLLYSMYKNQTKVEKATTVKQKVKDAVTKVTYYVKGKGLDIYYTVGIGDKIDPQLKSIWQLAGKTSNIIPLLM